MTEAGKPEDPSPTGAEEVGEAPAEMPPSRPLPPDPVAYDAPRNAAARARGLPTPYIPGGDDPDPVKGRREERYYGRLLIAMVATIVLAGFILGFVGLIVGTGLG